VRRGPHDDRGSADRRRHPSRLRPRRGGGGMIRRYAALIRNAWLVDLQYRASIVLWLLWGVTEPAIALGIWWAIAGDGQIAGYARADFARYFFAVMLINQLTIAWDSWYLDRWIRDGELNFRLARPLHPAHEAVAENTALMELQAGVSLFLAGRVAPLALLPPAVAGVAGALWFRSMLAFPVDLLTGAVQGTDAIVRGLVWQIVWLAVWVGAYRLAWVRG